MNGNQWKPLVIAYVNRQNTRRWRMNYFTNRIIKPTQKNSYHIQNTIPT